MKIEIESYKGQSIEYDIDNDKFVCDITVEDKFKSTKRASLKDVRKEIDAFIKLNAEFKPFKALFLDGYSNSNFIERPVEAIRTDGKFVIGGGWSKSYYTMKDMEKAMVWDADIVKEKERLEKELETANKKFRNDIDKLCKKLVKLDLSQYDKFISQTTEK